MRLCRQSDWNIGDKKFSFVPMKMIKAPSGATHFKIETSGAEIDFEN